MTHSDPKGFKSTRGARERPILFSAPMVRAILAGAKTQTRRVIKPQPTRVTEHVVDIGKDVGRVIPATIPDGWQWRSLYAADGNGFEQALAWHCPYGAPGDRLWVRETHAQFAVGEGPDTPVPQCVAYRATCDDDGGFDYVSGRGEIMRLKVTKWTPAIYMPRWASRITLEVAGVRVERLHDISETDAMNEGVEMGSAFRKLYPSKHAAVAEDRSYRIGFNQAWHDINGRESWNANPWVWVVEFRRVEAAERAA